MFDRDAGSGIGSYKDGFGKNPARDESRTPQTSAGVDRRAFLPGALGYAHAPDRQRACLRADGADAAGAFASDFARRLSGGAHLFRVVGFRINEELRYHSVEPGERVEVS